MKISTTDTDIEGSQDMTDMNQTAEWPANETTKTNNLPELVKREDLTIDPEFQKLFSANTTEAGYDGLREEIRRLGILTPLIGWAETKTLLDGHTRVKIYDELGMTTPLPIRWLSFPNREEARVWMMQHQVFRRNLNTFRNIETVLHLQDFYAAKAQERIRTGKDDPTQIFGEGGEVNEILGRMVETSGETVRKVKIIKEKASKKTAKWNVPLYVVYTTFIVSIA